MTRKPRIQFPSVDAQLAAYVRRSGPDDCWLWTGHINHLRGGYGQFTFRGTQQKAHRVAWSSVNGPIPSGMCICHRCDVPACCNPAHLFIGTHDDNRADMLAKGRHAVPDSTKTHCWRGHALEGDNLYLRKDPRYRGGISRACRACNLIRSKNHRTLKS